MNDILARTRHLLLTDHDGHQRRSRAAYSIHRLPVSFALDPDSRTTEDPDSRNTEDATDCLPSTFRLSSLTAQTTGLRSDRTIESQADVLSSLTGTDVEGEIAVAFLSKRREHGTEVWVRGPSTYGDHVEVLQFDHQKRVNPDHDGATSSAGWMRRSTATGAQILAAESLVHDCREDYFKGLREGQVDTEPIDWTLARYPQTSATRVIEEAAKSFREYGSFTALLRPGGCLSDLEGEAGDAICSQLERELLRLDHTYVYPYINGRDHLKAFSILSSPAWTEQGVFAVRLNDIQRDQDVADGYTGLMSYIYCPQS